MKHALAALIVQNFIGYITGNWLVGGIFMIGFFVGVEWMQEVRVQNLEWPQESLDIKAIFAAFTGWSTDRYMDCGLSLIVCSIVILIKEGM